MIKNFTLLELGGDTESPMIGTLLNITDTELGQKQFKERFLEAVAEHFDTDDLNHSELPDMFAGTPYEDVEIDIDGLNYRVRILETWMY